MRFIDMLGIQASMLGYQNRRLTIYRDSMFLQIVSLYVFEYNMLRALASGRAILNTCP